MSSASDSRECRCSWPVTASESEAWPVILDGDPPTFWLMLNHDGTEGRAPLRFCPSCGGALPRRAPGRKMDDEELRDSRELCRRISSATHMMETLGPPDKESSRNEIVRPYDYESRWQSLIVHVFEYRNGDLAFAWTPKRA